MQVLTVEEIEQVSGGDPILDALIAKEIEIIHSAIGRTGAAGVAFLAGYATGSLFNSVFESVMGQSFGSWLYEQNN